MTHPLMPYDPAYPDLPEEPEPLDDNGNYLTGARAAEHAAWLALYNAQSLPPPPRYCQPPIEGSGDNSGCDNQGAAMQLWAQHMCPRSRTPAEVAEQRERDEQTAAAARAAAQVALRSVCPTTRSGRSIRPPSRGDNSGGGRSPGRGGGGRSPGRGRGGRGGGRGGGLPRPPPRPGSRR